MCTYREFNDTAINCFGDVMTNDGKCDKEIRSHIGIAKGVFQKLSRVLRHVNISLETNKRVLEIN